MSEAPPLRGSAALTLRDLHKRFGATRALDGASLAVALGTVHGLIGQNGAGKSTIVNILGGLTQADAGTIELGGEPVPTLTPRRMERLGVHIIHQEPLLVPGFTVAEAMFLGAEPQRGPFLRSRAMHRAAADAIESRFGLTLRGDTPVDALGAAERQIVQISRALLAQTRLLVFDEPTASLVRSEADRLFAIIRRLRQTGAAILYVSHYLEEVRDLCDAVTVLRNGRDVATVDPARTSVAAMASMMIDRDAGDLFAARTRAPGAAALEVRNLALQGAFADISLTLRAGEILGLPASSAPAPRSCSARFSVSPDPTPARSRSAANARPRPSPSEARPTPSGSASASSPRIAAARASPPTPPSPRTRHCPPSAGFSASA